MPELVPQDSDANEFVTDKVGLLHKLSTVLPHAVHYLTGRFRPAGAFPRLHGYRDRIDKGLGVCTADIC